MASDSLQDIKRRIKSITSTKHVTNAMKLVSTAKLRVAKNKFESTNENLRYVARHIAALFNFAENIPEKYTTENTEATKTCYIVVTSSKGFCGGYNNNIIAKMEELIAENEKEAVVLSIGSKGSDYFRNHDGVTVIGEYLDSPEDMQFAMCRELVAPVIRMFGDGEIDKVILVYTAFENMLSQTVKAEVLLPFEIEDSTYLAGHKVHSVDVEFEPDTDAIFNYLVGKYFEIDLYANIIEAATCEHTARRLAMENATDNANDMLDALSLNYNRARQAAITSEITEIVAGTEVLK